MLEGIVGLVILAAAVIGAFLWARYVPMNEDEDGKWTR